MLQTLALLRGVTNLAIIAGTNLDGRILNAVLVMIGIPTLHITSRTEQSERDRAVRRFSEPSSAYTVMLTSTMLNAYGVDFHRACHTGLMLEEPQNTATAIQAVGRLYRFGQEHQVNFRRVIQRDTYDSAMEARNVHKFASNIAADANIDDRITGHLRLICATWII